MSKQNQKENVLQTILFFNKASHWQLYNVGYNITLQIRMSIWSSCHLNNPFSLAYYSREMGHLWGDFMNINECVSIYAIVTAVDSCQSLTVWPLNMSDIKQTQTRDCRFPHTWLKVKHLCVRHTQILRGNLIFYGHPSLLLLLFMCFLSAITIKLIVP